MPLLAVDRKENAMKKLSNYFATFIIVLISTICLIIPDLKAQTEVDLSGANMRAAEGDTVRVMLNHIKHDKRQQFEKFIHEIFWPKAVKLEPDDLQAFKQTRVLHPVEMNKDSTFTYVFLMDPLISNTNYSILNFLNKMYGEEKAKEYIKLYTESFNVPQVGFTLIQSQY